MVLYTIKSPKFLSKVNLNFFDLSTGERIIVSEADKVITFMVPLPVNRNYAISVTYKDYHPYSLHFDLSEENNSDSYHLDIPMNKPIQANNTEIDSGIFSGKYF